MTVAALVTFSSSAGADELGAIADPFANALLEVDGLISKTWLATEGGSGGFYLFTDEAALDAYLDGPLVAQLRNHPQFSDFEVRRFGVAPRLSTRTHGLPAQPASE